MKLNTDEFKWTRMPKACCISADKIEIVTAPHTDLWQRTYYHFRNDNATQSHPLREPKTVTGFEGTIDEVTEMLWNSLNETNKVSLFVRFVNRTTGETTTKIVNKNV